MTYLELIEYLRKRVAEEHLATLERRTGVTSRQLKYFSDDGGNLRDPDALVKLAKHYGYEIVAQRANA